MTYTKSRSSAATSPTTIEVCSPCNRMQGLTHWRLVPLSIRHIRAQSTHAYYGPAFAFDIDGVLLRGGQAIPAGKAALSYLYNSSTNQWRAPTAFITNSGGFTEASRAHYLSTQLEVPITPDMLVLSHSPLRPLAPIYNSRPGLIITVGKNCADVAQSYGFARVLDAEVYGHVHATSTPFATYAPPAPTARQQELAELQPEAVFVMSDSRNWGRDVQIIMDVLGDSPKQNVDLYFCNPDLTFPGRYHVPRLAGGCLRVALEALHSQITGRKIVATQFGKPFAANYDLTEEALKKQARVLGFEDVKFDRIFGVGDNPLTDVRGANGRGRPWVSVLVRTGNFTGENDDTDPADIVLDDAFLAVKSALG